MGLTRHGTGPVAVARALASQVHPVFMLPPLAASLFGGVLAGTLAPAPAGLHVLAMFSAVYVAHVKDGYVDFHGRGEDDDHPLTVTGCRLALLAATLSFALATLLLAVVATPATALLTVPTWLIAYNHAPTLDVNPVTTTLGYPAGIALALLGGYHAQAGSLAPEPVALAAILLVLLAGVKVVDDATDHDFDRAIGKRTVAVVLGPARAHRVAYGLQATALVLTVAVTLAGVVPPASFGAPLAFGVVAIAAARADAETATMLLVRGAYVFLAVLVAAVWFRPFA